MEQIDLKQIERDVWWDYFQDGLVEVLMGGYFLLIGLALPHGTVAPFIVGVVFFAPAVLLLKKRITYPRTGYVQLREGDPGPLPWFVLGGAALGLVALVAALIIAGALGHPAEWYPWMPVFFGIWLAGIFLGLALRVGLVRYYLTAAVALAGGLVIPFLSLEEKLAHIGLLFAILGGVLFTWGVVALLWFLHRYPRQVDEADDGRA